MKNPTQNKTLSRMLLAFALAFSIQHLALVFAGTNAAVMFNTNTGALSAPSASAFYAANPPPGATNAVIQAAAPLSVTANGPTNTLALTGTIPAANLPSSIYGNQKSCYFVELDGNNTNSGLQFGSNYAFASLNYALGAAALSAAPPIIFLGAGNFIVTNLTPLTNVTISGVCPNPGATVISGPASNALFVSYGGVGLFNLTVQTNIAALGLGPTSTTINIAGGSIMAQNVFFNGDGSIFYKSGSCVCPATGNFANCVFYSGGGAFQLNFSAVSGATRVSNVWSVANSSFTVVEDITGGGNQDQGNMLEEATLNLSYDSFIGPFATTNSFVFVSPDKHETVNWNHCTFQLTNRLSPASVCCAIGNFGTINQTILNLTSDFDPAQINFTTANGYPSQITTNWGSMGASNGTFTGTVTAAAFVGPGSLLTQLQSTNIAINASPLTNFGAMAFNTYYTNVWGRNGWLSTQFGIGGTVVGEEFALFAPGSSYSIPVKYFNLKTGGSSEGTNFTFGDFLVPPGWYFAWTNNDSGQTSIVTNVFFIP
jgi:hypothetical protein